MTAAPAAGCACRPPWPALVVRTEAGDVAVAPSSTPGGLACLYLAYCTGCGAAYPGPFRVQPAPGHQAAALTAEVPVADPHPNDGGR